MHEIKEHFTSLIKKALQLNQNCTKTKKIPKVKRSYTREFENFIELIPEEQKTKLLDQ